MPVYFGRRLAALTLLLSAALAAPACAAAEVAGVAVAPEVQAQGQTLALVGAGLRSKFIVKVYVAALYAARPGRDAQALIESPAPRRLRLQLLRDVDAATLDEALQEGLRDNTAANELAAMQPSARRLTGLLTALGTLREGDVIDLDFDARGVEAAHGGKPLGRIDDPAFARALLRVWLGDKPAQSSLKKALLGG